MMTTTMAKAKDDDDDNGSDDTAMGKVDTASSSSSSSTSPQPEDKERDDNVDNKDTTVEPVSTIADPPEEEKHNKDDKDDNKETAASVPPISDSSTSSNNQDKDMTDTTTADPQVEVEMVAPSPSTPPPTPTTMTTTTTSRPLSEQRRLTLAELELLENSSLMSSGETTTEPDEYDVIVLYQDPHQVPFYLKETVGGEVAFHGYVSAEEPCSTIRNMGDVLLSIDGASTLGNTVEEVTKFLSEKARHNAYSFCRFRSVVLPTTMGGIVTNTGATTTTMGQVVDTELGQLPGERQRNLLEQELLALTQELQLHLRQVEDIQATMEVKKQELKQLKQSDLEWIEQKSGELDYQI